MKENISLLYFPSLFPSMVQLFRVHLQNAKCKQVACHFTVLVGKISTECYNPLLKTMDSKELKIV